MTRDGVMNNCIAGVFIYVRCGLEFMKEAVADEVSCPVQYYKGISRAWLACTVETYPRNKLYLRHSPVPPYHMNKPSSNHTLPAPPLVKFKSRNLAWDSASSLVSPTGFPWCLKYSFPMAKPD